MKERIEKDSLGELKVPADAYYGIHTTRSKENFKISGLVLPAEQIEALAFLKLACAKANMELGLLSKKTGNAIVKTSKEIISGQFRDQFAVDIFQAGSGTSSNMNVNEVIANRSSELLGGKLGDRGLVHPNDHVNKGQSTNNIIPSSIRVASVILMKQLIKETTAFSDTLTAKAKEFDHVIKSGRTHLQDAVPIRMGQVFRAFGTSMKKDIGRLKQTLKNLSELGVGGNAVGTGINTPSAFRKKIISHLNAEIKEQFRVASDGVEATHSTTDLAEAAGAIKTLSININRICNDLRLMSSGPNTGLNELNLPAVEPGSSIMPGKVNPSVCEAVNMVCYKVFGNIATIESCAAAAQLELNVTMPVTGFALIESLNIMREGIKTLRAKCVAGITVNKEQCKWYTEQSPSLATFLNPYIGYDRASAAAKKAVREHKTIPEIVREDKLLNEKQLKEIFAPKRLTSPGR